jgi:hypothetical protein
MYLVGESCQPFTAPFILRMGISQPGFHSTKSEIRQPDHSDDAALQIVGLSLSARGLPVSSCPDRSNKVAANTGKNQIQYGPMKAHILMSVLVPQRKLIRIANVAFVLSD